MEIAVYKTGAVKHIILFTDMHLFYVCTNLLPGMALQALLSTSLKEVFFKILWPSQNTLNLPGTYILHIWMRLDDKSCKMLEELHKKSSFARVLRKTFIFLSVEFQF